MATVYSGYSKGWKPSGSDIYRKYRARVDYSVSAETPTTITYRAILYVNINSSVSASYSGTLNISGTTYTGSCKTMFGKTNTVTCVSAKTKTFKKGATATTATIKGGVRSSNGSWTGATVTASATVSIPALTPATITFNANDGSGTVPSAISTYVGVANTIPSNSLTRTGYTFNGWNTASDGSGTAYATGSTITPTGDVTLYAQWKTTYVKPKIQNLLAFRVVDKSGGATPSVTSTGTTGFCKFELVGGDEYTFDSATVQFGTATAQPMTISGSTAYGYSDVGSIAEESAYNVKIDVVVKGTDGVYRTYTDSTYISKAVPIFDATPNTVAFGGTAKDTTDGEKRFDCYMDAYFSDGVTVGGHDSPIGTRLTASKTNITITAGIDTHHDGASLTLGKGTWIAMGRWSFGTRASGTTSSNRQTSIVVNGTTWMSQRVNAYGGNFGMVQCVTVVNLTNESNTVMCKGSCSQATSGENYDSSLLEVVRIA